MGGGYNIITNLHPCKTHPCLLCLCVEMCRWKTYFILFLLFLWWTLSCCTYPGC